MRLLLLICALILPCEAMARDAIHAAGSSTVFPFVSAAAEQFGRETTFRTPIVESVGTGGGFQMFCEGVGGNTPDISDASRPIKPSEIAQCKKNGVDKIAEIKLGYDGIVFVTSIHAPDFALTKHDLFLALARDVPKNGKLVTNFYEKWNEIDSKLPDIAIRVYGPPPTSGTRDAFAELVMTEACKAFPEYKSAYADDETRKHHCQMLREDGGYIEAGENDNLVVQKLSNDSEALAIFGYSFLEENGLVIKAHAIDGVMPEFNAIIGGQYHVARSLYVYIKLAHVDSVPGMREFLHELTSDAAMGDDGYLILKGLLPLAPADLKKTQKQAHDLTPLVLN